jgi:hypothetical protein
VVLHFAGTKEFEVGGDLVLKWDRVHEDKPSHTKFKQSRLGPYQIAYKVGLGTYSLKHWRRRIFITSPSMAKF